MRTAAASGGASAGKAGAWTPAAIAPGAEAAANVAKTGASAPIGTEPVRNAPAADDHSALAAIAANAAIEQAASLQAGPSAVRTFPAQSVPPLVPLVIIGGGGHGRVVREIAEATGRFAVIAIADDAFGEAEQLEGSLWHCPVAFVPELLRANPRSQVIVAIGANHVRRRIVERLALPESGYAAVVHPGAHVSPRAAIAPGTVVMPGAVVNAGARIGAHAIVNSRAVAEHDTAVGAYAHLSPNAAIAGGVIVGEGAHLGIGCAVIPSVAIGEWAVLGAGAAAVTDIPARVVAVGVPAKVRRALDSAEQD